MAIGDRFIRMIFQANVLGETNSSELWFHNQNGLVYDAPQLVSALHNAWVEEHMAAWQAAHSVHYTLNNLLYQVFTEAWVPLLVPPISEAVSVTGTLAGNIAGRSQCMLVRFSLNRTTGEVPTGMNFPQGGRLFRGPMPIQFVTNTNGLNTAAFPAGVLASFLSAVSSTVTVSPIGSFGPIRVSAPAPAMLPTDPPVPHPSAGYRSWARIASASVAPFVAGIDGRDK